MKKRSCEHCGDNTLTWPFVDLTLGQLWVCNSCSHFFLKITKKPEDVTPLAEFRNKVLVNRGFPKSSESNPS